MKTLISILLFILSAPHSYSQVTFQKLYSDYIANKARQTFDAGFVLAGNKASDFFLMRTDVNGDILWSATYGGSGIENAYDVSQTSDSGFIVIGNTNSFGAGNTDIYLMRISSNGNYLWSRTFGGPGLDAGYSVRQTTDGGFILTGTYVSGSSSVIFLIKTNPSGNLTWINTYSGLDGTSVRQTADGGYILTGQDVTGFYLIKTDSFGNLMWLKSFDGVYDDRAGQVEQTTDGGYIIGGHSFDSGQNLHHINFIKTDMNGDTLWTRSYGNNGDFRTNTIEETTDGGFISGCIAQSFVSTFYEIFLLKTDSLGNLQWSKKYAAQNATETCYSVEQTFDRGYILQGTFTDLLTANYYDYLLKTDSLGNSGCNDSALIINLIPYAFQLTGNGGQNLPLTPMITLPATLTNAGGSTVFTLCSSVGRQEVKENNSMMLSPNPASGEVRLTFGETIVMGYVEVCNLLGETIFIEAVLNETRKVIDLNYAARGIYIVKVFSGTRMVTRKLLIG